MTSACRRIPKAAIPAVLLLSLTLEAQAQYVLDSIDVGGRYVGSMCYSTRSDVVYGGSNTDNFLFAIDCSTNQVVSRVGVEYPGHMAYSATSNKVYCTFGSESLLVVDGVTHQRIKAMLLEWAAVSVWDSVADRLFVSCTEANRVTVIDCAKDTVIKHIQTPAGPARLHLNHQYRKLYVQCYDSQKLCIVDLRSLQVSRTLALPGYPEAGCYSEAADKYYCGAGVDVVVVDGSGDTVIRSIALRTEHPLSAVSVESHRLVMVGGYRGGPDTLYIIDAVCDSIVKALPGVARPFDLYWSDASDLVYCTNYRWDQVAVIAGNGSRMLGVFEVGDAPFTFTYSQRHRRLYVGHLGSRKVYVIRDTVTGVAEREQYDGRPALSAATVVSGSYELKGGEHARLVDIAGRLVAEVVPGVNDVRRLPPGVYAMVGRDGRHHGKVVKIR